MRALLVLSVLLLGVRLWAAAHVGFGDSEALYASWAIHPQPAYLDHPGLVGLVARLIGEGAIPTPLRTHLITTALATAVPWVLFLTAWAAGAKRPHAASAALVVALVPEIAVGLFALTPDLLLALTWLGALGLASFGLRRPAASGNPRKLELRSAAALLAAGLLAGIAAAAKVSGLLLIGALVMAYAASARAHDDAGASRAARSIWPWAGLGAGVIVIVPMFLFEAELGYPMLRHRFVETQHGAGPSLVVGNIGALAGGQLLYLSPVLLLVAGIVAKDLLRRRRDPDAVTRLLFWSFALPLAPLVLLSVWSSVAEPHWIAPPLLALPIHAARTPSLVRPRLVRAGSIMAAVLVAAAHAWVLVPASARLVPESADPKLDIASELYGWPSVADAIRELMARAATPYDPEGREVVVVGPHWTVCAQVHAALPGIRVGCATPIPDDFDRWFPRDDWRHAEHVLFVTDNRFPGDGADQLPIHVKAAGTRVRILRGGRTARVFELALYARMQRAAR